MSDRRPAAEDLPGTGRPAGGDLPGTARPAGGDLPTPASSVPWDLSHLRWGLAATAALAVILVPVFALTGGGRGAAWAAAGLAIVALFFCLGALAVAAAGRIGEELTLPAALGSYLIKVVLLGVLLVSVQGKPWLDPVALGISVLVGTLTWTAVHALRVWRTRIFYVDR